MSKVQRKGSFESAGLKKTRLRNAKEERVELLFAGHFEDAVLSIRAWIEDCIDLKRSNISFNEFIDDGTILCELIQYIRPGLIKKISRVKSRFAYWENFTFFLKACKSIGLHEWQLFDPEELLGPKFVTGKSPSVLSSERRVKNIVAIVYWLAVCLESSPYYTGPRLDHTPFATTFSSKNSESPCTNHSSLSPSPISTPACTPEHKLLSVSSPNIEQKRSPPSSPNHRPQSGLLWVGRVQEKDTDSEDPYFFAQSDTQLDDYGSPSQPNIFSSNSTSEPSDYSKRRKEILSVRVEAYNPPSAFNADLVFVQDSSTSSSVFSPTGGVNTRTPGPDSVFSPNHLSNTFGAPDPIDSTGLIIDPLEFHSQVFTPFTAGTDSQESDPHFTSPRPESTYHINLTQTSQPDNLSISNTQLDDLTAVSSELPVISEVVPNSSPIDTFDLHRTTNTDNNTPNSHSNIEYSHSQEYNERQINHIDNHTHSNCQCDTPNEKNRTPSSCKRLLEPVLSQEEPISNIPGINNTSVNYSRNNKSVSPLIKRNTRHSISDKTTSDRNPPYRRYSSPQQRPGYKSAKSQISPTTVSESGSESETDMALTKANRSSARIQMKVVPSDVLFTSSHNTSDSNSLSNGLLTIDLHATFLPAENRHGIILQSNIGSSQYPVVSYVEGDTPASRCGVQPHDELVKVNDMSMYCLSNGDANVLLKKAINQRKLSVSIHRDTSNSSNSRQYHSNSVSTTNFNTYHQVNDSDLLTKVFPRFQSLPGLDLKRVHSDALPKHQVASTVYASENDSDFSVRKAPCDDFEISNNNIVDEVMNNSGSNMTKKNINTNLNVSPSPSETELKQISTMTSDSRSISLNTPHPIQDPSSPDYTRNENTGFPYGSGKSQSVTELSTITPLPTKHTRDKSDTGLSNYYRQHAKATKAESLPGKFRVQSLYSKDCSPSRSSVSTSGLGLGIDITNMSLEDMHSASKLQIDQIWKEVETSSSPLSPVDNEPKFPNKMDTIYTQTPDEWQRYDSEPKISVADSKIEHDSPIVCNKQQGSVEYTSDDDSSRGTLSKVNEKKGIESLLNTLRSLNEKVGTYDEEPEFKLLESILQSSKFRKAKELHDNMRSLVTESSEATPPFITRVLPASHYIRHFLREDIPRPSNETEELRRLLKKPNIQSVLFCHDKVSTHDLYVPSKFFPRSAQDQEDIILTHSALDLPTTSLFTTKEAPLSRDIPCNRKENATIVYLQRSNRPLGCAIYKDGESVFVSKILEGCDAEQSGAIKEGDELLEVNGIALLGKSNDEIIRLMSGEAGKTVSFTLIPVHDDTADLYYEEKYVRAHFSYNGQLDEEIPCKELSLNFSRGDILEISNQDDPDWWQARKVFEDGGESLPGLIPARQLQQRREVLKDSHAIHNAIEEKNRRKSLLSMITRKNKKKKIYYNSGSLAGAFHSVGHEVATYEDVVKLIPDPNRKRPIILIGAPSVGRKTLIKRMIDWYPRHYATCIQHITRSPKPGEIDGRDYHFVTRDEMEAAIQDGRFLDYIDSKGCLCGVAISSIKDVIDIGKVPILALSPQSMKLIGSSGLIPYVIFVSAPRVERLLMTRKVTFEKKKKLQASLSADYLDRDIRSFTENELIDLYHTSQQIHVEYSHYFDWVVVNDDLQIASDLLLELARRIEEEPQWVSASWVEEV